VTPDPEDIVELSIAGASAPRAAYPPDSEAPAGASSGRPYLSLFFRCANKYTRVYRNVEGTAYDARCPTCGKTMRFAVGPGGSSERFFTVSCSE